MLQINATMAVVGVVSDAIETGSAVAGIVSATNGAIATVVATATTTTVVHVAIATSSESTYRKRRCRSCHS